MKISLITGDEPHYQLGLVSGLARQDMVIDVIGGDSLEAAWSLRSDRVAFKNLRRHLDPGSAVWVKLIQVGGYYLRLMRYVAKTDSQLFHVQWPYKLVFFDRTLLNLYYKALGKKLVFTAHNVDREARDGKNSWLNRLSLRFLYRIVDHIIVHTDKMKSDLIANFAVNESKISVIPHGINIAVPNSGMERAEARKKLCLVPNERVVLFFGLIDRYKGLDILVEAMARLKKDEFPVKLIVAGKIKECPEYWQSIQTAIQNESLEREIILDLRHIPDESVEVYFKAADALVMPYRAIFQSGVLFLAYRFGLPVIASDVGSLKNDVVEGKTGLMARAGDPGDLAQKIRDYFQSDLFKNLEKTRKEIQDHAFAKYSWASIGDLTQKVYCKVLKA